MLLNLPLNTKLKKKYTTVKTQAFSARLRGLLLYRGGVQLPPMRRLSGVRLLELLGLLLGLLWPPGPHRAEVAPTLLTHIGVPFWLLVPLRLVLLRLVPPLTT